MSVLIYAESLDKVFKKAVFETITYAKKTADLLGTDCVALVIGEADNPSQLGKYGADKILHLNNENTASFDAGTYSAAIADTAKQIGASVVILSHTSTSKSLIGRIAVRLDAGSVSAANALPSVEGDALTVSKNVFSGKAIATYQINSPIKVISLVGNSIPVEELSSEVTPESLSLDLPAPQVTVVERSTSSDTLSLPEAELVVSAGRGMKGPENWGIIEELAEVLNAATACSRPVADVGWRPHHEHVGQTGVAIRPNLYFAIGISGAIQHLAGVNSSKTIVVVNKDPEAPFFKEADYGVLGDLFEVVPRLTESLKKFKASNN